MYKYKKILSILSLSFAGIALSSCAPAIDGERNDITQYETAFRDSIINSCLADPNRKKKNKAKYCVCYANSFVDRFDENTLNIITEISAKSKSPDVPTVVNIMMTPEISICQENFGKQNQK